jgi:hypothetical protein
MAGEASVQLQSTNARTRPKTEEHQRPESKTSQQLAQPAEICKTSTPGLNPGGASKILSEAARLFRVRTTAASTGGLNWTEDHFGLAVANP